MNPKFFRNGIVMLVLVVGTAALLFTWISTSTPPTTIGYSEFLSDVAAGDVTKVVQQGTTLTVTTKAGPPTYTVIVPTVLTDVFGDIQRGAEAGGQPSTGPHSRREPAPDTSWLGSAADRRPAAAHHRRLHLLHDAPGPGHQ